MINNTNFSHSFAYKVRVFDFKSGQHRKIEQQTFSNLNIPLETVVISPRNKF